LAPGQANPVLGTARVLRAYAGTRQELKPARAGVRYLVGTQNDDGGWGGAAGVTSSIEETALAVTALCDWRSRPEVVGSVARGTNYLVQRVEDGTWLTDPAPIGLYFAHLWYSEALYPAVWTVEALGKITSAS
jgi:squalene-hopene/tetraprenyl-beta-curcumene cyclase